MWVRGLFCFWRTFLVVCGSVLGSRWREAPPEFLHFLWHGRDTPCFIGVPPVKVSPLVVFLLDFPLSFQVESAFLSRSFFFSFLIETNPYPVILDSWEGKRQRCFFPPLPWNTFKVPFFTFFVGDYRPPLRATL